MKISHLFEIAYNHLNKAETSLQNIWKELKFKDFSENDLPNISSGTGGSEIFLEWRGKELDEEYIINIMEERGYILPQDFDIKIF